MKLEDEIYQKKFQNQYEKLAVNLMYTGHWVQSITSGLLKDYDLTIPQYNTLRILRGQHPNVCTVNTIIERMIDKSSNVSRIIDRLVKKNLVSRKQCKQDRRAVDLLITSEGLELLHDVDQVIRNMDQHFMGIGEDQVSKLNDMLDAVRG